MIINKWIVQKTRERINKRSSFRLYNKAEKCVPTKKHLKKIPYNGYVLYVRSDKLIVHSNVHTQLRGFSLSIFFFISSNLNIAFFYCNAHIKTKVSKAWLNRARGFLFIYFFFLVSNWITIMSCAALTFDR